jgi:MFS transporter, FHS family, Na+ dependent glucose transporter 1
MTSPDEHDAPVWVYLGAFVVLGSTLSVLGPALSHLRDRVGTTDAGIGGLFVGQSIGYIAGSMLGGRLLDRGHGHRTWAVCLLVSVGSIVVISQTRQLPALIAWFAVMGLACGVSDVSGNTLVVWSRPGRTGPALNGLHLCFAVGALLAPVLTNRAIAWSHSLWPAAVPLSVLAVVCAVALLQRPPPTKSRSVAPVSPSEPASSTTSRRTGQLAVVSLFFFVYVGMEVGFGGWIHSYVEQIRYGGANTATAVNVTFWAGFTVGRVVAIWLSGRLSAGWILVGSTGVATAASAAFVVVNGGSVGLWIVVFMFGAAIAPQFASMINYAETHLALSGASASAFIAAAGLAGLVMPWSLGLLFDARGPGVLPPVTMGLCAATVAAGLWVRHMCRHVADVQRPPVTSMNAPVT